MDLGIVREVEGGYELRFERHFDQPVEEVWEAITDPAHLEEWLGAGEIELTPGGRVRLQEPEGERIEGEVIEVEAPFRLSYTWDSPAWGDGGPVRYELAPDEGGGTLLVFTHVQPAETFGRFRYPTLARWQASLANLTLARIAVYA